MYTTQNWFTNKIVSQVTRDWSLGAFLQYGSGLPLTPPAATNTNYIGGSEQFRVPGQPLYHQGPELRLHQSLQRCRPEPGRMVQPANGTFGPATGTLYGDFRSARRPQENMNFGRTFRIKENVKFPDPRRVHQHLQSHADRQPQHHCSGGRAQQERRWASTTGGFGAINLTVSGPNVAPTYTQNAVVGQLFALPRTGTLIARISF